VRSDCAGGAEQIVLNMDALLTKLNYRSFVLASSKSRIKGRLIAFPEIINTIITEEKKTECYRRIVSLLKKNISYKKIDILHFHGVDFHHYLPEVVDIPMLVTLHLPIEFYPVETMIRYKNIHFNFVSEQQRMRAPSAFQKYPVICNGIDFRGVRIPVKEKKSDYILCIGRICPEKGFDTGLRIAKKTGIPLKIAGKVYPYESHIRYFNQKIAQELDNSNCQFIGVADKKKKITLMTNALCVLIPSQIDETSSLVAMESLYCGTPVVASNRGALPSIVEHGITGYICRTEEEMEQAVKNVHKIDRTKCMKVAESRFSADTMVKHYIELYEKIIT
jgi:glycosyltransferase involved in cell wall biosynthesis